MIIIYLYLHCERSEQVMVIQAYGLPIEKEKSMETECEAV